MELIYAVENGRLFIGGKYNLPDEQDLYNARLSYLKANFKSMAWRSVTLLTLSEDDNIYTMDEPNK